MKKETKELVRHFVIALMVMMVVPLAYRVYVHFCPPDEKPRQNLAQFLMKAESEHCTRLLKKPVAKWTDSEAQLEPEIYAWLKEQGNEILPWEWTDEARRKDPKGYVKCWRRIWKERKSHCERRLSEHQKEIRRLNRELLILTTIHAHRTNQIARLRSIAATNAFPCQVALERLEKGRFWGWNRKMEVVDCKDAAAILAGADGICGKEAATADEELSAARALGDSLASLKEKSAGYEKLREICDQSDLQIESDSFQDEALEKSLVESLKGAKKGCDIMRPSEERSF